MSWFDNLVSWEWLVDVVSWSCESMNWFDESMSWSWDVLLHVVTILDTRIVNIC